MNDANPRNLIKRFERLKKALKVKPEELGFWDDVDIEREEGLEEKNTNDDGTNN